MVASLHRSRFFAFICVVFLIAAMATASADLADLTRELDGVQAALDKAVADANAGKIPALQSSLKSAQEAWSRFFVGYRGWGSGVDPSWITDVDAIQAEFMNATNAVSPGNNAPLAAASLKRIQELLAGLRERNNVPDVDAAMEKLTASLDDAQKSMKALQTKGFGPDSLSTLSKEWLQVTEDWTVLNKTVVEANALNLSDGDLAQMKQRVERQSLLFEAVGKALGNSNISSGLTSISSAIEGLKALASQFAAQSTDGKGGDKKPLLDPSPKRRLKFR